MVEAAQTEAMENADWTKRLANNLSWAAMLFLFKLDPWREACI